MALHLLGRAAAVLCVCQLAMLWNVLLNRMRLVVSVPPATAAAAI
jgi:hypothetical protein